MVDSLNKLIILLFKDKLLASNACEFLGIDRKRYEGRTTAQDQPVKRRESKGD